MPFILHDSQHAHTRALSSQEIPNFKMLLERREHGEELSGQISPPAVRWVLICCWNPQLSLLSYLTHLPPSSCQPFIFLSLLLHTMLVFLSSDWKSAELPLGFAGPCSSKVISHSGIEWTKSLEASDRRLLAARVTNSRAL